ncbi:hypothetical protein ACNAUY_08055 [Acinetobacter tibetensis]|uniref:hypothetical protein n=1 Tax=Acinetobacter tibetensis TaxID=2943497 RepID=UPI003A4DAB8B
MTQQTAEVELPKEKAALALKLIDRSNKLEDEIKLLQSIIAAGGVSSREEQLLHDELDVVRDYREVTLERVGVLVLGDKSQKPLPPDHPNHQPVGLGSLGEMNGDYSEDNLKGWEIAREAMFNASVKK